MLEIDDRIRNGVDVFYRQLFEFHFVTISGQ